MRLRKRALAHIFRSETRMQRAHFRFLQPKKFLLYRFFDYLCTANRGVEQLAARWAHNPKVGGSSPPPATKKQSNVFGEGTLLFCFTTLKPSQKGRSRLSSDKSAARYISPPGSASTPSSTFTFTTLSGKQPYRATAPTTHLTHLPFLRPLLPLFSLHPACYLPSLRLSVVIHTFIILTIGPRSNIV